MGNVELLKKLEQLKAIRAERESLEEQEAALIDEVKAEMLCRGVEEVRMGIHHAKWTKYTVSRFLDAPLAMSPYLEQIALALYGNNVEKASQIVLLCMQGLAAREHSHFENVGPVQVLGGRL